MNSRIPGLFLIAVLLALPASARADCATPAAKAASIVYNADHNVMQYCNGSYWVATGSGGGTGDLWTANGGKAYYNSGNVGIGTSDPQTPLHVVGTARFTNSTWNTLAIEAAANDPVLQLTSDASSTINDWTMRLDTSDGDKLQWRYDNAAKLTVDSDGNVGLGTTNPGTRLDIFTQDTRDGLRVSGGGSGPRLRLNNAAGNIAMLVNSSGDVGIGTTSVSAGNKMEVRGAINITAAQGAASTNGLQLDYAAAGSRGRVGVPSGNSIAFNVGGAEKVRIDSAGRIGINVTNPGTALEVGVDATQRSIICGRGNSQSNCHIDAYDSGSGTRGIYLNYFTGTGVYLSGGASVTSDIRKKRDIETIPDALAKIDTIRGVSYRWKDPKRNQSAKLGVIAQEVQKAFPEVVHDDGYGFLTVEYTALIGPLIEAVKELKALFDDLVEKRGPIIARLDDLETENAAMKTDIGQLKADNDELHSELRKLDAANDNIRVELDKLKANAGS